MQKKITQLNWMFVLNRFLDTGRKFEISILMTLLLGLFSNSGSAQSGLALENFNSGVSGTWLTKSNTTVTNNWEATATGGNSGTGGAMVDPDTSGPGGTIAEYFLITPQFTTPDITEIRFMTRKGDFGNQGTRYELRISTTQPDVNNFVTVQTWKETQLVVNPFVYEEKIVTLPAASMPPPGTPVFLAFVAIANQTEAPGTDKDTWFVDDVRVVDSCGKVTGITTTMSGTSTDVVINWTHNTANNFEIQVVPEGTGLSTSGTQVTGKQYAATGLTDGVTYDVYLKTVCDFGPPATASLYAGPFKFTTQRLGLSCATPLVIQADNIATTPYVLSANLDKFNDTKTYVTLDSRSLSCQPFNSTQNWLSGDHAFLSYTPLVSGLVNVDLTVSTGDKTNNCYNNLASVFIFDSCTGIGTTAACLGSAVTGTAAESKIPNVYLEGGKTYYFVISSAFQHLTPGAGMCFTFTLSQPSCSIPAGITSEEITQTAAKFSWSNPKDLVSEWQFIAKPVAQGAPVATDVLTTTTDKANNIVSGLAPNTKYNFYVRSLCPVVPATVPPTTAPGDWSQPFTFTTLCTVFPTPYSTMFTGATAENPEPCWTAFDLNHDGVTFSYSGDSSPGAPQGELARLRTMSSGSNTNEILASPQVYFDGNTQKRVRFKFKGFAGYTTTPGPNTDEKGYVLGDSSFAVKLSTTGVGPNNFTTELEPVQTYVTGNNWVEKIIPIPQNIVGNVSIAWVFPPGYSNMATNFTLDDVYIEDLPACSPPSYPSVTAGSITTDSAQFFWANGYKNTDWEIAVQPFGSGVPTTSGEVVSTNPFTKHDIKSSTRYEYYIRTHCSDVLQSEWVGPVAFNTLCDAQPVPYYESFDDKDVLTSKKFCWSVINKDNDTAQWRFSSTQATIQPQSTASIGAPQFSAYDDYLVSVKVNAVGTKILKFKYLVAPNVFYPGQRSNYEVLMSSTPDFAAPTVLIPSHEVTANPDFVEESVIFEGTGPAYFAIHLPSTINNPKGTGPLVIDDFSIDDVPKCTNPSSLSVSNVSTNSATLSWTKGVDQAKWEIVIQKPQSGVPTVAGEVVDTNPTYEAKLSINTSYEYYVRAVCGSDYSEWIGPKVFKTICDVLPTPFIETFEADSPSESCWVTVSNNNDENEWYLNSTTQPIISGTQQAALICYKNGNNDDWMITPTLAVKPNQRLRFYYRSLNAAVTEDLKVQVSTEGTDISKFTTTIYENNITTSTDAIGTVAGSNKITVASVSGVKLGDIVDIPGYLYSGTTVTAIDGLTITLSVANPVTAKGPLPVIFNHEIINNTVAKEKVINLTGITAPTNLNFAFHVPKLPGDPSGKRGSILYIDNVIVEDIPACPSVYNVATNNQNLSDTTAAINWETTGSETSWQVSVQPYGTAAPKGNTLPEYLQTATAHPYTITGLTPSTKYQYYVRPICGGTSDNAWVGPIDLLTKCDVSNSCTYTISLKNGTAGGHVYDGLDVIQNGVVQQTLIFPTVAPNQPEVLDYEVFLCPGIEFSLYWRGGGSGLQYKGAQVVIKDQSGNTIFTTPAAGLGTINSTIFTGISNCKAVTCPQPTNLAVNNLGVLSWTPGTEKQWEVFVQPLGQGSIPLNGHLVKDTPSYTPVPSDFLDPSAGTYEFFVRAVCGDNDKSYWTGPKVFVRNDEPETAVILQVNTDGNCNSPGKNASFIGATASVTPTSCSGVNGGDIWYEFVATSKVHTVELSNFNPGSYSATGGGYNDLFPTIILSLYEKQADGSLIEKACSENNSLLTTYSSELTVGKTYMIRVKLVGAALNDRKFDICESTPADICELDAFNYSFEKLPQQDWRGDYIFSKLMPGWRTNTNDGIIFVRVGGSSEGEVAYEGGQFLQLLQDSGDAGNPNIKGLYKDFEVSSDIKKINYSFAVSQRAGQGIASTVELWAGPPTGPFIKVAQHTATIPYVWTLVAGTYDVPTGQTVTRFIFRGDSNNHSLLDAANFKVPTNNILTENEDLNCDQTSVTATAEQAEAGVGEWFADTSNPAQTVIETPKSPITAISGFNTAGVYTYYWKTRYCEKPFKVTYNGLTETPTVATPVEYCLNETPMALISIAPDEYSVITYTSPVGGSGDVSGTLPTTAVVGKTTYYLALVNAQGCIGPRKAVDVYVNDLEVPVLGFSYDKEEFCQDSDDPVLAKVEGFTAQGSFTATPEGLAIDPATGAIDLSASTPDKEYTITYSVAQQDCHLAGSKSVSLKVGNPCGAIPKGISPNGDGSNDNLVLSNVKKISIFNRYGTEVYSHGEGYIDQWHGQSNSGQKLPDGTYFYTLVKEDNIRLTGWIYIIN